MDITSFLLGYKSGEVDLQEKTATPGTSDIVVLPDDGYGGLSKVTVEGDSNLLPENILSGVDIFGVSGTAETGGGGGSLPAGVYLSAVEVLPPLNYPNCHFVYKGELYLWAATGASTSATKIYKFVDGAWTQIVEFTSNIGQNAINPREFKGKLHAFSSNKHAVFDGSTVTALTNPPDITAKSVFEHNGKLYAAADLSYNTLYVWNEATDKWEVSTDVTFTFGYIGAAWNYNGDVFCQYSNKAYKLVNGAFAHVGNFSETSINFCVNGGFAYYFRDNKLYKYNLETNENVFVGYIPIREHTAHFYVHNGLIHIAGGANDYREDFAIHEIEATE